MTDWTPAGAPDAATPGSEPADPAGRPATPDAAPVDLDEIERELDGVEVALARLDAGTYWTDEVTGERLPDELLERDPTARRSG